MGEEEKGRVGNSEEGVRGGGLVVRAAEIAMLEWALADKMQARWVWVGGWYVDYHIEWTEEGSNLLAPGVLHATRAAQLVGTLGTPFFPCRLNLTYSH